MQNREETKQDMQDNETKRLIISANNIHDENETSNALHNDDGNDSTEKNIILNTKSSSKKIKKMHEANKRIVTTTKKWLFSNEELSSFDEQLVMINKIDKREHVDNSMKTCIQELNKKIYGYKTQDLDKKLFDETLFVDFNHVIKLFIDCDLDCYYCKNKVKVIYEFVREPKQWSLERIDNRYGHNIGNVVIACLSCNLKRRTMYHERFVFTKQLKITKIQKT